MEQKYVVKVSGTAMSLPLSRTLAEQYINNLQPNQQPLAEIVPVSEAGKEILLG